MASRSAEKGKRAEREVVALLDYLGFRVRRRLIGRTDDAGDIEGLPNCVVQVKSYVNMARAVTEALFDMQAQRHNAGVDYAAGFIRRPGGSYFVVMQPETFIALLREATDVEP